MAKKYLLIFVCSFLFVSNLFSSGFQINEHGAKAMSLAGAFTAYANDPSAVQFNPAALAFLKGTNISFGSSYIRPSGSFDGPDGALKVQSDLKNRFFTPINFYITHQINDKLAVGFGLNNPYGLGTEWEEDWVGRYNAVRTEIRVFNFTPVISYKFSDKFSIGVGANIGYADVEIERKLPVAILPIPGVLTTPIFLPDGNLLLTGDDIAIGFNVSLFYKASDKLTLGASYKYEFGFEFEGEVERTLPSISNVGLPASVVPLVQAGLNATYPTGKANAPLTAPSVFTVGLAYHANDNLTFTTDFQYTNWSSYDNLTINFEEFTFKDGTTQATSPREYENSFILRFGAEYVVNENFTLRGGFLFDQNPIKDERVDFTLPDNDRYGLNLGFGYKISDKVSFDLAYMLLIFPERTITNSEEELANPFVAPTKLNGTYNPSANLIGANFTFNL